MKNTFNNIALCFALAFFSSLLGACHYLDVDPELGITEEDAFSSTTNALSFIGLLYDANDGKNKVTYNLTYPFYCDMCQNAFCQMVATTDAADCGRLTVAQKNFKACNMTQAVLNLYTFSTVQADKPIANAMFKMIRVANKAIEGYKLIENGKEEEKYDFLGQAYFARAMAHFVLCRYFGGMPYIDYVIGADDEWDIPRESLQQTYLKAAEDAQYAYECFAKAQECSTTGGRYLRRNSASDLFNGGGAVGVYELKKPSGMLALALKSRILLYAASPLSNVDNDPELWKKAADAAAQALTLSRQLGYELLPLENYTDNYFGASMTNEVIWGYAYNTHNYMQNFAGMFSYCQSKYQGTMGSSGTHPTQNFVDRFETADGHNLYDVDYEKGERLREEAAKNGWYNPQDPYSNRDPRMDMVIIHDGSSFPAKATGDGIFNIYYDPDKDTYPTTTINSTVMKYAGPWGSTDLDVQAISNTGYYCSRHWNGTFSSSGYHLDPCFRIAELYLNFAEAMNEYYGPQSINPEYSELGSAVEAINVIRERVGMPAMRDEYVAGGKDVVRQRIQNERCVEMAYESNHYYFDIRRWMIAPQTMNQTLYGMEVEKVTPSAAYPLGRKFTRKPIPQNRQQIWKDCMYYIPFPDRQANTMKNFKNNDPWK